MRVSPKFLWPCLFVWLIACIDDPAPETDRADGLDGSVADEADANDAGGPARDAADSALDAAPDGEGTDAADERDGGADAEPANVDAASTGPGCALQDPASCGAGALCCRDPSTGAPVCVPAGLEHCGGCGEGCGTQADGCSEGACRCGDGPACTGDSPLCIEGACVAEADTCIARPSLCADQGLVCDSETLNCVDGLQPWQPDCTDIPLDAPCGGGPVEVLLAMHAAGRIAMLDPQDGHFMGYLKANHLPADTSDDYYRRATQGPDMCIWTVREGGEGVGGVERWDTDGSWVNAIIPAGAHRRREQDGTFTDLVDDPADLTFTADSVIVSSPAAAIFMPMVTRFSLDGELLDVVLDDGSGIESLLVLGDGTFAMLDTNADQLVHYDPLTNERTPLWEPPAGGQQVHYMGAGQLLATSSTAVARVDVRSGERDVLSIENGGAHGPGYLRGAVDLGAGGVLFTRSGEGPSIGVLDFEASSPQEQLTSVWDDLAVEHFDYWQKLGRACVPQSVVDAAAPTEPETSCPGLADGQATYAEDFEGGDALARIEDPNGLVSVDDSQGAAGSARSLRIEGAAESRYQGAIFSLPAQRPSYVGFHVRFEETSVRDADDQPQWSGYFALSGASTEPPHTGGRLWNGFFSGLQGRYSAQLQKATWYRVELRNIDWEHRSYDFYLDCDRLAERVPFDVASGDDLQRLDFFQPIDGVAMWVDELTLH